MSAAAHRLELEPEQPPQPPQPAPPPASKPRRLSATEIAARRWGLSKALLGAVLHAYTRDANGTHSGPGAILAIRHVKLILHVAQFACWTTGRFHSTLADVARALHYRERTVRLAAAELVSLGVLERLSPWAFSFGVPEDLRTPDEWGDRLWTLREAQRSFCKALHTGWGGGEIQTRSTRPKPAELAAGKALSTPPNCATDVPPTPYLDPIPPEPARRPGGLARAPGDESKSDAAPPPVRFAPLDLPPAPPPPAAQRPTEIAAPAAPESVPAEPARLTAPAPPAGARRESRGEKSTSDAAPPTREARRSRSERPAGETPTPGRAGGPVVREDDGADRSVAELARDVDLDALFAPPCVPLPRIVHAAPPLPPRPPPPSMSTRGVDVSQKERRDSPSHAERERKRRERPASEPRPAFGATERRKLAPDQPDGADGRRRGGAS